MTPPGDDTASHALDAAASLPSRNVRSIVLVLAVQTLNFFNDNFVKMLLVALAIAVARGTELGERMQVYVGAIFTVPYIVLAPLAGFLSDRHSKQRVIFWTQVTQVIVFVMFIGTLWLRMPQASLLLSLVCFLLLSAQATILSPAKMGIMKDLAGSRRLGTVSGLLQMTMMAGILVGMWAGGTWFGERLRVSGDPWGSAMVPMLVVTALALLQIAGALLVQRTPGHPQVVFQADVLWEHFGQLGFLFDNRALRTAVVGKTYFWLVSNALMLVLVDLAKTLHPDDAPATTKAVSLMSLILGVGVMLGSLLASLASRKRINLHIVPAAGVAMAAGLVFTGLCPVREGPMLVALLITGAAGGCFMVPLYAYVQDRALPHQRARVLAGINLLDSLCGLVAAGVVWVLARSGVTAQHQMLVFAAPTLFAALLTIRLIRAGGPAAASPAPASR
jgi:acyl-[acyl-carrier-protein]-phospholipid O-acyltransferase/long-chain-fatty-acid--[acyl-carrier-protein] ligase